MFTPYAELFYDWFRGRMQFHISKESYKGFIEGYMLENRGIREQVFTLDTIQTMFIIHSLETIYNSRNKHYWYLFFHDNCSTRIRDLILQTYDNLNFPESLEAPTYRDLINPYLKKYTWAKFLIDVGFGMPLGRYQPIL